MGRLDQLGAEQRHDRHRDEVGREQRQHHGQRERREQEAAHAVEERHRKEDDRAGQRRRQHRQRDLVATLLRGDLGRLAHLHVAEDVLEHDHRVVDQAREHQREPGQDHRVDRAAAHVERDDRRQHGQRNRQEDRHGRAKAAEEHQHHQRGQREPDAALVEQRLDRALDEQRLVEHDLRRQLLRHVDQAADQILHAVDDGDGVGVAALLHHRQVDRRLAVDGHDVVLDLVAVLGAADVAHRDRRSADGLQRDAVDVGNGAELAVGEDGVVERPDLHVARRQNQVRVVDRADHVHRAHLVRLQLRRIDVDHDLAVLAAEGRRHRRAVDAGQLVPDGELPEVAQLRFVQPFALQRDQTHRQARGVELLHDRRQRAGRQAAEIGHRQVRDLVHVRIGARPGLEEHLDDADAGQRARLHVIDAGAEREEPLEAAGDVGLDLFRRHAGVERRDDHLGNVDVGKQIDRHPDEAGEPDDGRDQRHDDDEVRVANREAGHQRAPSVAAGSMTFGVTSVPGLSWARLPMTTRSPAARPLRTSTRSGASSPTTIVRAASRPSPPTTSAEIVSSLRSIACTGATSTAVRLVGRNRRVGVHPGHQLQLRVRHVHLGLHRPRVEIELFGEAGDLALEGPAERLDLDVHRRAHVNARDRRFRHLDDQPQQVVLREPDDRHRLALR